MDAQKNKISENEFMSFCRLLEDEEGKTFSHLCDKFKRLLQEEPSWRSWIVRSGGFRPGSIIPEILRDVQWEEIGNAFQSMIERDGEAFDLERGLVLLSLFSNPDVKVEDISRPLDQMAFEFQPFLDAAEDPEAAAKLFRQFLFKTRAFHGNSLNYYDPDNSYLHKVLDRKVGIPISLACVCLLLARRLRWKGAALPLVGVGLPTHFIVQFNFPGKQITFDPFNRGKILTRKDCLEILRLQEIPYQPSYFAPTTSQAILSRMVSNLIHIYNDLGEELKRDQLLQYLQILNDEKESF